MDTLPPRQEKYSMATVPSAPCTAQATRCKPGFSSEKTGAFAQLVTLSADNRSGLDACRLGQYLGFLAVSALPMHSVPCRLV